MHLLLLAERNIPEHVDESVLTWSRNMCLSDLFVHKIKCLIILLALSISLPLTIYFYFEYICTGICALWQWVNSSRDNSLAPTKQHISVIDHFSYSEWCFIEESRFGKASNQIRGFQYTLKINGTNMVVSGIILLKKYFCLLYNDNDTTSLNIVLLGCTGELLRARYHRSVCPWEPLWAWYHCIGCSE